MEDKNFCMSSYLAFRYVEKEDVEFYEGLQHRNFKPIEDCQKKFVSSAKEIDAEIKKTFESIEGKKKGILLSGGMDSAILASYMPGCDAYTFRFIGGDFRKEEMERAQYYSEMYGLRLHYVDIEWSTVEKYIDPLLKEKSAPVHSIEPQILQAAMQAKEDGIEIMVVGESSDLIFGGMDQLLSKDWTYEEFKKRYIFTNPEDVLKEPCDMSYLFDRYRLPNDKIDFLSFMDNVFSIESSSSYLNAFYVAGLKYIDPYANMKMKEELDLTRVRNGEPKYLIRELFSMKYPDIPVPNKIAMPRPVDFYFSTWSGPKRHEFIENLNMDDFSGNQKWQIYCLEKFLDMHESE